MSTVPFVIGAVISVAAYTAGPGVKVVGRAAHTLKVKDTSCIPGSCVCLGTVSSEARLSESGPRADELRSGIRCVVADFDGNGLPDFAVPGGEGFATVFFEQRAGDSLAIRIDAGGPLDLYAPRQEPGSRGEPASENHAILVRSVGRYDAVFRWNGATLERILVPLEREK